MTVAPNTKMILTGAALLMAIVGCMVTVTRAITNDQNHSEIDDGPLTSAKIVNKIRNLMNNTSIDQQPTQAYIIPSIDAHQNEYPAPNDKRVQFVSSFTGSNALIVITEQSAVLWTDSRYFQQAENQLDNETWTLMKSGMPGVPTYQEYLISTLNPSSRVAIDPFLITAKDFEDLKQNLHANGQHTLLPLQSNLVDLVWENRPKPKLKKLETIEPTFSGKKVYQKLAEVRAAMQALASDLMVVTALEDIAWLLNLRGNDLEYSPLFFSYLFITDTNMYLYLLEQERAVDNDTINNHFQTEHIDVSIDEYNKTLSGLFTVTRNTKGKVLLWSASQAIQELVHVDRQVEANPIMELRIIKNDIEAQGMREAHKRDGAAIIKYLYWLETEIDDQNITEIKGAEQLKIIKEQQEYFNKLSFPTISAVGEHASMPHYTATSASNKKITRNEIYLIDSGSQYKDGTTDITRTVHFGEPSDKEKDAFTRVLKGFISVATAIFPPNAPYSFFDAMARRALWDVGLDFSHATGHGVGAYLNVHEEPPVITEMNRAPGMCKNMFTSNEPGYYEEHKFGIRIEDVIQVVEAPNTSKYFGKRGAYKFDDITMVPIQKKMINVDLLSESEIEWLNEYHESVRNNVSPLLSDNSNILEWLERETQPIKKKTDEGSETASENNDKDENGDNTAPIDKN